MNREIIDLRSDTITLPTPEMRRAIAEAEVADDVHGEDPTANKLEARVTELLGKEAAVFMPSGTMSNQIAIRAHTEPGDEIFIEAEAHAYFYEAGAPAALAGVMCRLLPGKRGIFSADDVERHIRPRNLHFPPAKLVCLENTHNRGGGSVWPLEQIASVAETAKKHGLKMHLDGARLWNASAATGISEKEYSKHFDTVSVCFSKGLGAPVGSALAGTKEMMARARRFRKQFGGGLRQAGIVAAGALFAIEHNRKRLSEDHSNARLLAEGISRLPGIELDIASVETNIVIFNTTNIAAGDFVKKLSDSGVRMLATGNNTVRAVTHLNVTREQVSRAIEIIKNILKK